jgi:nicotinamide riboside kinase
LISRKDYFRVVVLSGPVSSGKSLLAENLRGRYQAQIIKTRDLIRQLRPKVKEERGALQRAGEALDRVNRGAWVKDALVRLIESG